MLKNIVISFAFILVTQCLAQSSDSNCDQTEQKKDIYEEHLIGRMYINLHPNIPIQFFNPWQAGDVYLENGTTVTNKYLRYNGLNDQLLWIRKSDFQSAIVERQTVKSFILYNEDNSLMAYFKKINVTGINWGGKKDVFMQVLVDDSISLYVYRKVDLYKNRYEFFLDYAYYIHKDDQLQKIKLNRWSLYKILPEYKKEIRSIIRSHYYKPKKENDLKNIFKHLNRTIKELTK